MKKQWNNPRITVSAVAQLLTLNIRATICLLLLTPA